MKMKLKRTLTRGFWGLVGLFVLYVIYGMLVAELNLSKYEKVFAQAQHPPASSLIDSLSMEFEYYPATYVDDSIDFKSAYLVGELRQYTGSWEDIKNFYYKKTLEDNTPIVAIPVEIHQNGRRTSLDIADGYPFSPFDAAVLSAIQDYYRSRDRPQSLIETEQRLYMVYSAWTQAKSSAQ